MGDVKTDRLGIVCGLVSEARALDPPPSIPVAVSGARPDEAEAAAERLAASGATALFSIGLAGALVPALAPGDLVVPALVLDSDGTPLAASPALAGRLGLVLDAQTLTGADEVIATPQGKARLHAATGAAAVDMESHRVARVAARHGLPFLAIRAIADPADRAIPPAARNSIDPRGGVRVAVTLWRLFTRPQDLHALKELGRDSATAHRALATLAPRLRALQPAA